MDDIVLCSELTKDVQRPVQELHREKLVTRLTANIELRAKAILNSQAERQPFQIDCGILVDEYSTSWPLVSADFNNEKGI